MKTHLRPVRYSKAYRIQTYQWRVERRNSVSRIISKDLYHLVINREWCFSGNLRIKLHRDLRLEFLMVRSKGEIF
jgi:hypothetical protein